MSGNRDQSEPVVYEDEESRSLLPLQRPVPGTPDTPQQYRHSPPVAKTMLQRFASSFARVKTVEMIRAEIVAEAEAAAVRSGSSNPLESADDKLDPESNEPKALPRVLGLADLVAYGVGSTVGAGVFVITGVAAKQDAGPALFISFLISAIACLFSGLCYCEFATRIPVAGSAYTYAYATLGELIGFLIGWNLTLEYGISASAVARGWAGYLEAAFNNFHVSFPKWLTSWDIGFSHVSILSVVVIALCTILLCYGVKQSAKFNLFITVTNMSLIVFIIILGAFHVDTDNLSPLTPFGVSGVIRGAARVFFSYVGFDTVSGLAGMFVFLFFLLFSFFCLVPPLPSPFLSFPFLLLPSPFFY